MGRLYFLYSIILAFLFYGCSGMYDNLDPYYNEGETNYIAKPDSVTTKAGTNRVELTWRVSPDPRIKELYVTWNDGADHATVPVDFSQLNEGRYLSVVLEPVAEGSYVFYLHHLGNGHMSVPAEAEARSYGELYQSALVPRAIRSVVTEDGNATITWKGVVENCDVAITYTDMEGNTAKRSVAPTELTTVLENVLPESTFSYVSAYLPEDGAIDRLTVTSEPLLFP